jgi:O-antigen ligase
LHKYYFFLAFLASSVFLVALLRTNFALIILIFSMLLSPEFGSGAGVGHAVVVRLDDVLLIAIFLGWLAKMAINKELGLLRITPLNKPILMYISISILATLVGAMQGYVSLRHGIFYLLKYIEYFLLFFMVVNNLKTVDQSKRFVFFILLTAFLVCVYGWSQIPEGGRVSAPFEGEAGEPNTFAGYLLLMMPLTLGLALFTRKRVVLFGLLGFMFVPFIFTLSRGGWISFVPMFLTVVVLSKEYRFPLLLAFAASLIVLIYASPQSVRVRVEETFVPDKTYTVYGRRVHVAESAAARIDSWGVGFNLWVKRPLLGYGIPYGTVVDNQYTRVLAETGIVGFLAFAWLLATIFRMGLHVHLNAGEDGFIRGVSVGFMAGFVGILSQSLTAANFVIIRVIEPFWLLTAIMVALPDSSEN